MNISDCWIRIDAVSHKAELYDVFELFCNNPSWPLLPVIDDEQRPLGVIREYDLKRYAYARFGRELVKQHSLSVFLKNAVTISADSSLGELLETSAKNPNPDGIIVTVDGKYHAVLLPIALLHLFEKQHLESEVRMLQAQKMEAIGTLAGGVAHDLNNILTPILGYSELISLNVKEQMPIDPEMLDQIVISGKRAKEVVKQMLSFSRQQESERCPIMLGEVVKESLKLVRASLPASVDIEVCMMVGDDQIIANSAEIHRIVLNLCTNAHHAMRDKGGGHLVISLSRHFGPIIGWTMNSGGLKGEYLRLSVRDSGTGINPEMLPRIFEPFFTTKKQGDGTGLGLSVVHGIVARGKGLISVETSIGQGTTFHVYLPSISSSDYAASTPYIRHPQPDSNLKESGKKTIRVFMVDDEYAITRLAKTILGRYSIAVETENDSVKAFETLKERCFEFDLLITDHMMPGMTGTDLIKKVLALRSDMPVIMCTGYSEILSPEQAKEIGISEFLFKPPDFYRMAEHIHSLVLNKQAITA